MSALLDNPVYARLSQHRNDFGSVQIKEYPHGVHASFDTLVEFRGDGLRTGLAGYGQSRDEALEDLWDKLTRPGRFFSVAVGGYDFNYGWDGQTFVRLPSTSLRTPPSSLVHHLAQLRARNS